MRKIDEQQAKAKLEKGFEKAGKLLNDKQKLDVFLDKLEIKLKMVPVVGESLSMLPVLFSLVKSFIAGEYKEIPLAEFFINAGSEVGDVVLDPFAGSGTTIVVSERLNRRWVYIDSNKEYASIAEKWLEAERSNVLTGTQAALSLPQ